MTIHEYKAIESHKGRNFECGVMLSEDETNMIYYLIGKIRGKSPDEIVGDAIKFYRDAVLAAEKSSDTVSRLCVVYNVNSVTSKSKWSALENVERELDGADEYCE